MKRVFAAGFFCVIVALISLWFFDFIDDRMTAILVAAAGLLSLAVLEVPDLISKRRNRKQ